MLYLCTRKKRRKGAIAQLVEQRTENPCVPGSIPGGTTKQKKASECYSEAFLFLNLLSFSFYCRIFAQVK